MPQMPWSGSHIELRAAITRIDPSSLAYVAHSCVVLFGGPKPTRTVRLVLDEMSAAVIRSLRVTTAVQRLSEQ
jgi:hypothetical protein